jgi:hypothetical protein
MKNAYNYLVEDMLLLLLLNKYENMKINQLLVNFVSSLKMITISNHNQKLIFFNFYVFLYNKLQLFLKHHVHYTPFICG